MGRLSFGKLKYLFNQLLHKGLKFIPYKYKKPLFLISSILGLLAYFKFMLVVTNSEYLYMVPEILNQIKIAFVGVDPKLVMLIMILLFGLLFKRYIIPPSEDNKAPNKSLYREVNGFISFMYIVITILGILPSLGI